MVKVKTEDGFKAEIDERILTDWRFTRALVKSQKGTDYEKLEATNAIADMLLGDDSDRLCEHIASKNDGFVPATAFMNAIAEIMKSVKTLKN